MSNDIVRSSSITHASSPGSIESFDEHGAEVASRQPEFLQRPVLVRVVPFLCMFEGGKLDDDGPGWRPGVSVSAVGVFALQSSTFDLRVMLGFGVLGSVLRRFDFPVAPIVIGMTLGPIAEASYRLDLLISDTGHWIFLEQPISAAILALCFVLALAATFPDHARENLLSCRKSAFGPKTVNEVPEGTETTWRHVRA